MRLPSSRPSREEHGPISTTRKKKSAWHSFAPQRLSPNLDPTIYVLRILLRHHKPDNGLKPLDLPHTLIPIMILFAMDPITELHRAYHLHLTFREAPLHHIVALRILILLKSRVIPLITTRMAMQSGHHSPVHAHHIRYHQREPAEVCPGCLALELLWLHSSPLPSRLGSLVQR